MLAFVRQQAHTKHLQLETQVPADLPDLYGDERRLRQVLINLFTNTVKFTPEGGRITVTASYRPLMAEEIVPGHDLIHPHGEPTAIAGIMSLAVADTGIGISPEDAKRPLNSGNPQRHFR